jgi:uncharacterized protein (DUF302 family)
MTATLGFEVQLDEPFDRAVARTRDALKAEGFGVLTEIDLRAAFQEKLQKDFKPYVILGACNPPLAFAAVSHDPRVGLLLPCNVTVEADGASRSIVRLTDPEQLLGAQPGLLGEDLLRIASDARARMERVTAALERK